MVTDSIGSNAIRPSRLLRARSAAHSFLGRTEVDGWFIESVGTAATEPDPGTTITVNATATNADDSDDQQLTVPVRVNGSQIQTLTFEAAVTGVDSQSFELEVPSVGEVTVSVGGESFTFRTSEFEPPPGTLELVSDVRNVPNTVRPGEQFTVEIEVGCTGSGGASCPSGTLRAESGGRVLATRSISGLDVADVNPVSLGLELSDPGERTVTVSLAGQTEQFEVTVEQPVTDTEPSDQQTQPDDDTGDQLRRTDQGRDFGISPPMALAGLVGGSFLLLILLLAL